MAYVFTRDEAYGTYDPALIPDLFPSNATGYRVGWQDSLGMRRARRSSSPTSTSGAATTARSTRRWSTASCSATASSTLEPKPYMADVMPTLLELYGVQPPTKLDGRSLLGAAAAAP